MSIREGTSSKKGRELAFDQKSHTCESEETYKYVLLWCVILQILIFL